MATVKGKQVINNMQIETSTGTVYWQEDEPLEPKDGDTWFKVVNGKATNSYNREDGAWVEVAFSSQIIAEELIGKIITGAEINGGIINGTEINGGVMKSGAFLNEYTFKDNDGRVEGFTSIQDGLFASRNEYIDEPSEVTRQNVGVNIQNGAIAANNTIYNENGIQTSYTGGRLTGGELNLSQIDSTGSFNGTLDAKLLESISGVKKKTITIPNNANFTDANIEYYRWGQFVLARFYFNLLKSDGFVGLTTIEPGYRPINFPMASQVLPSTSGASRYCTLYANANGWRIIPSTQPINTIGTIQGSVIYLTNDPWQLATTN